MILSRSEKVLQAINLTLLLLLAAVTLFPILYVVSVSLTPLEVLAKYGSFQIIPREITLEGYKQIIETKIIPQAFLNSVIITVAGTLINMVFTTLMAYPLSRKRLPGRNIWLVLVLIPMLFSGGLVPLFILVKELGMMNTFWSVILPGAIATYNLLIMKSFFETLPEELIEATRIDGANELVILWKIVLPLSAPVLATISLFYAVGHWNNFFGPMMFLNDTNLQPLQVVLRNILADALRTNTMDVIEKTQLLPGETLKMAAVVISVLPLMVVYPWLQKYFTKGVLIGSIKG